MLYRIPVKKGLVDALEELCQALEFREHNKLAQLFAEDTLQNLDMFKKSIEEMDDSAMEEVGWGDFADIIEPADTVAPTFIVCESEDNLAQVRSAFAKIGEQIPEHKQDDMHQKLYGKMVTQIISWLDNKIAAQRLNKKRISSFA